MWLVEPQAIQPVLLERPLQPPTKEVLEQSAREWQSQGVQVDLRTVLRNMPVASIGQPETWPLQDLYSPDQMPHPLLAKATQNDFYLIRLSCSFRSLHQESRIQWARFLVQLLPDAAEQQPTAYDLYPQRVVQEVKHHINVTLSPMLTFQELKVSPGSVEFGLECNEQQPVISAALGTGVDPSWDYTEAQGMQVQGTKWMYLLVKAPKGLSAGQATLDLVADVVVRGKRFPVSIWRKQDPAPAQLTVQLWR
jgi:hypothetical protein